MLAIFLHFSFTPQLCNHPALHSSQTVLPKDTHAHTVAQFRNFSSQSSSHSTWLHPLNPGFLKSISPLPSGTTLSSGSSPTSNSYFSIFLCLFHLTCLSHVGVPEFYSWLSFPLLLHVFLVFSSSLIVSTITHTLRSQSTCRTHSSPDLQMPEFIFPYLQRATSDWQQNSPCP